MAEGAEPLKPQIEIPSAVILITINEVAGFRGENMKIVLTTKQRKQLLKVFAYIEGIDPEGRSRGLVHIFEGEDHALDKLYEKLLRR